MNALRGSLKAAWENGYYKSNRGYFYGGAGIIGVVILATSIFSKSGNSFMGIWSSLWGIGIGVMLTSAVMSWRRSARSKDDGTLVITIILTVMTVLFISIYFVISLFIGLSNFVLFLIIISMASVNSIFFKLIKAHTLEGRRIMDRIDGFRMYLSTAEKDRMNLMNPPERTPELFERYLPYALALGVEQQWGEQFAHVLSDVNQDGTCYYPRWYRGTMWNNYNIGEFTSFLGNSFSGIISAASNPPGSSSGRAGGGFSGGGGGGGGW